VGQVDGLSSFDPTTEKFINYRNDPAHPASVGINNVSAIYQDRSGTLWFGTWMGTLSRFDDKTNTSADRVTLTNSVVGRIHAISRRPGRNIVVGNHGWTVPV
jgi:ligand-binding sensor domain-containing protein